MMRFGCMRITESISAPFVELRLLCGFGQLKLE